MVDHASQSITSLTIDIAAMIRSEPVYTSYKMTDGSCTQVIL